MTDDNVQRVRQTYEAIGRADIPTVISMMTDDAQIHFPGPAAIPFAGTHRGAEGVGQFFQVIGANVTIHQFEPREFIAQGDEVVVLGHEKLTATPTGRAWETDWAMVWTLRDGQVSLLREFHDTDAIATAFR